jgi:hypothetical protein
LLLWAYLLVEIIAGVFFFNLQESFTGGLTLEYFRDEINSSWAKFEGRAAMKIIFSGLNC